MYVYVYVVYVDVCGLLVTLTETFIMWTFVSQHCSNAAIHKGRVVDAWHTTNSRPCMWAVYIHIYVRPSSAIWWWGRWSSTLTRRGQKRSSDSLKHSHPEHWLDSFYLLLQELGIDSGAWGIIKSSGARASNFRIGNGGLATPKGSWRLALFVVPRSSVWKARQVHDT